VRARALRAVLGLVVALAPLGLAGCGADHVGYLLRAGWSEARILLRREPIDALLARPGLDPTLRDRLTLVLRVRDFAAHTLGLRVGDSYATFAAVDGDANVWVLAAAERDRLAPYTWWFPIVGRVPYRGFFTRDAAEAAGRALAAADLDVDVRPAVAFSTLGWFADPVLSTVAAEPPVAVAETVLHELFHATCFVPGAARFNESAANFAGHRGAVAFFCSGAAAEPAACTEARRRWRIARARGKVLGQLAARLERVYGARPAPAVREAERVRLAAEAGAALARRGAGRRSDLTPPNNARLLGELLYVSRLDVFDRLAPADDALPAALAGIVQGACGAPDPFAAVDRLASRHERG
jgi:predicted aminopeptidase